MPKSDFNRVATLSYRFFYALPFGLRLDYFCFSVHCSYIYVLHIGYTYISVSIYIYALRLVLNPSKHSGFIKFTNKKVSVNLTTFHCFSYSNEILSNYSVGYIHSIGYILKAFHIVPLS